MIEEYIKNIDKEYNFWIRDTLRKFNGALIFLVKFEMSNILFIKMLG